MEKFLEIEGKKERKNEIKKELHFHLAVANGKE